MKYTYRPKGVCSQQINLEIEDGVIRDIEFIGGCNGNAKGVSALCRGRRVEEVAGLLKGITCGFKKTSCPDQLSRALEELEIKA